MNACKVFVLMRCHKDTDFREVMAVHARVSFASQDMEKAIRDDVNGKFYFYIQDHWVSSLPFEDLGPSE